MKGTIISPHLCLWMIFIGNDPHPGLIQIRLLPSPILDSSMINGEEMHLSLPFCMKKGTFAVPLRLTQPD